MNMEDQVREALLEELQRQAEGGECGLTLGDPSEDWVTLNGRVDLAALAMAVAGALAGGP